MKKILFVVAMLSTVALSSCINPIEPSVSPTNSYTVTFDSNGGSEVASQVVKAGEKATKPTDPTKNGYTFVNWTYQEEEWSFDTVVTSDMTLVATWSANVYEVVAVTSDAKYGTITGAGSYAYNSQVSLVVTPNPGYRFAGWYENDELVNHNFTYTFTMPNHNVNLEARFTISTYTVTYELDGGENSPNNPTTFTVEDNITLEDASKTGCTFGGWTLEGQPITTISNRVGNITLVANWSINSYTVTATSSDTSKGTVSGSKTYEYNSEVTLVATPATECVFKGWYSDSAHTVKVHSDATYTFTMPAANVTLYAKFLTEQEAQEEWDKAHGVIPVVDETNKTVTYGLYPQTILDDGVIIDELEKIETPETNGWYLYEEEYYAKAVANPDDGTYDKRFSNNEDIVSGNTYWFKCEPITWKILNNNEGNYYLLSDLVLDSARFDETSNNYAESEMRIWLNDGFYNSAFALHKTYVITTTVDNSITTTDVNPYGENPYVCEDTEDNVFLASYKDYNNTDYGFNSDEDRKTTTTDYSLAKGVVRSGQLGCPSWTRSPASDYNNCTWPISHTGEINEVYYVYQTDVGARPAIMFSL